MKNYIFSIIIGIGLFCIAVFNIFFPTVSMSNIANVISLPLFLLSCVEIFGHIRTDVINRLDKIAEREEIEGKYLRSYCAICKDDADEQAIKLEQDYECLTDHIVALDMIIGKMEKMVCVYYILYIIIGMVLLFAVVYAQEELVRESFLTQNSVSLTMAAFALFIIEPVIVKFASNKIEKIILKKREELAKHVQENRSMRC